MDIATIVGIVGGLVLLIAVILLEGSHVGQFINLLPALIVIGGASLAALIRYSLGSFARSLTLGLKTALFYTHVDTLELLERLSDLADLVRKNGPLALESVQIDDPFLAKGLQMITDGFPPDKLIRTLERERDLQVARLEVGHKVFKALGEAAPGMGMVGTLIGLVSMFSHMDDPKKIGPGLAVALLATLYGAVISNLIALPLSDKMSNRAEEDAIHQSMIIDGLVMIYERQSGAAIRDMLVAYLPTEHRKINNRNLAAAA